MWHKQKNKNPIIRLALLLALASTPMMTSLFKSDYVLAQSAETPSFPLPTEVEKGTTIKVDGSASMTRANEALKQRFEKEYSGTNVEVATNGTDDALKALQEGNIDIAAIGRGLTPEEQKLGLQQQRLRREKIAVIVGKDNPFKGDLSNQNFTKVYRGQIDNWSELGGPSKPIRVVDRPEESDTRQAFNNYPLFNGNLNTGSNAIKLDSDDPAEVVKQLGDDGIGFVLANQVEKLGDKVRVLSMHKVLPTDPRYPYSQPLVYVFKENPSEAVKDFVGFATAKPGQQALKAAREAEAAAVAAVVARGVTNDEPDLTATPAATTAATTGTTTAATPAATTGATPQSTEAATADGTADSGNETANNGTNTEGVAPATNASASDGSSTGDQAFLPGDSAGISAEAGEGTIPWWWILLPVAAIGALALWWLLGRRKSQEDDTVARGVLPKDSPPPFTPNTTTTGPVKEPLPVANTQSEPNAGISTAPVEPVTPVEPNAGINAAPVEPANTTSGINAAGIAAGAGIAGLAAAGAAALSRDKDKDEDTDVGENNLQQPDVPDSANNAQSTFIQQPDVTDSANSAQSTFIQQPDVTDSANSAQSTFIQQPDVTDSANNAQSTFIQQPDVANPESDSIETPDLQQPDIPDTSLDLEAPAAVVNSSYHSLPRINTSVNNVETPPATEEVGNSTPVVENPDNQVQSDPQEELPSASTNNWLGNFGIAAGVAGAAAAAAGGARKIKSQFAGKDTPESTEDESVNSESVEIDGTASYPQLPDVWDSTQAEKSNTQSDTDSVSDTAQDNNVTSISDLWGPLETAEAITEEEEETSFNGLIRNDVDNVEQTSDSVPSSLWGTADEEPISEEEEATSFSGLIRNDVDAVSSSNELERSPQDSSSTWGTPETEQPTTQEAKEEKSSFSLGGVAAAGAGIVAGAAAIGSSLLNRDNRDTPDDGNNTENNNTENQDSTTDSGKNGGGWFLNRLRKDTPEAADDTQGSETVETNQLPEVRITNENEQLGDAPTTVPQEQPTTDGLPNVWVTQQDPQTTAPEETVSEEEIAQYGVSSTSDPDSASTDGATALTAAAGIGAFALSQTGTNDEESEQPDAQPENEALNEIANQAEIDTQIRTSAKRPDPGDTDWDRIYGIHHNGATGVPGESNILLANRTPKWAYASWNIAPGDRQAMQEQGAFQLVLRLYDVTNVDLSYQDAKLVQQYECEESVSHRYVAIPNADRDYITEIGYITLDKEWLLVSRSPIIRVFSRPHKDFWFEADAELIIHGATEPGSMVTIDGQTIKIKQDGTFHLRVPFTESLINYLITAVAPDCEQAKTIHMQFSQTERKHT